MGCFSKSRGHTWPVDSRSLEMKPISEAGLKQLKLYQYKSSGYSPLDNFLNKYLWNNVINLLPMWMAPNLVTLLGVVFLVLGFGLTVHFCPNLDDDAPSWLFIVVFLCHFIYQTLDAVDGKQARRTNSSSPLGQLFDHGCDSLGTFLIVLPTAAAVRLGNSAFTIAFLFLVQGPFFMAQWEDHHTHNFRTYVGGGLGVTEGQTVGFLLLIASFVLGSRVFLTPVSRFLPAFAAHALAALSVHSVNHLLVLALAVANAGIMVSNARAVWTHYKRKRDRLAAFVELIPLFSLLTLGCFWKGTSAFASAPWVALSILGALFSHLTTQMIICGVTHMRFSLLQWTLLPMPFIVLNSYLPQISPGFTKPPLDEKLLVFAYFAFVCFSMYRFLSGAIAQITEYLGIYCFSLTKRTPAATTPTPEAKKL